MSKIRIWIPLCCSVLVLAAVAQAQMNKKAGLYEVSTTMNMTGMPQMPQGAQGQPGMHMSGAPFTSQVCVTKAMIDKFGGPAPEMHHGQCQVTDLSLKSNGMSAKMVCTGQVNTTGTVEAKWVDANTVQSSVHMTGTMTMGQKSQPLDMTVQSTSTYKGADCGSVKPMAMPATK